jgi:hypothetical protein
MAGNFFGCLVVDKIAGFGAMSENEHVGWLKIKHNADDYHCISRAVGGQKIFKAARYGGNIWQAIFLVVWWLIKLQGLELCPRTNMLDG